ncbi:abortive infection system toxin AbiGii family protein [Paenibacillus sp. FSL L8-0663]|uniref:abortive infection system toxin AbiGii family protein n=1 Tax=Paenibacillus sp. FSL L8-0663 TaxID=2921606 RepID=UPI0030FCE57D
MFSSFKNAFQKQNKDFAMPKEIIEYLNEQLPSTLKYRHLGEGAVAIVPNGPEFNFNIRVKVPNDFKPNSPEELLEFFYRTQQKVSLEGEVISINGTEFRLEELVKFPLHEKSLLNSTLVLQPHPFQPPFPLLIEGGGIKKELLFQRQPYADMHKSLFQSVNEGPLMVSYILNEELGSVKFTFNMNIENSKTVEEIVESLKLFNACQTGTLKILNEQMPETADLNNEGILETIDFWNRILALETRLGIVFTPEFPVSKEDALWFDRLYRSFIENKPYKQYIKIDKFSTTNYEGIAKEKLQNIDGVNLNFIQENDLSIMGVTLKLYESTGFFNFKINDLIETNPQQKAYDILIEPSSEEGVYCSIRSFVNLDEAKEYLSEFEELRTAEVL